MPKGSVAWGFANGNRWSLGSVKAGGCVSMGLAGASEGSVKSVGNGVALFEPTHPLDFIYL